MNLFRNRSLPWLIVGVVGLAGVFVTFDFGGPIRSVVTLLAVLVAPGLAASLWTEAMSADLRVVFATIASAAIFLLATVTATLIGSDSGEFVFFFVALVTIALAVAPAVLSPADEPRDAVSNNLAEHHTNEANVMTNNEATNERREHE